MKGVILPKKVVAYKNALNVENLKKDKPMQIGFNEEYLTLERSFVEAYVF